MKKEQRRVKKLNNRGFSLVEIIIVIAIMAILAGALAPQLMKYVEKSRQASDKSNCDSIRTAITSALADEDAYDSVTTALTFTFNGVKPTKDSSTNLDLPTDFINEVDEIIGDWPKVKEKSKNNFKVIINTKKQVEVTTE